MCEQIVSNALYVVNISAEWQIDPLRMHKTAI